MEKLTVKDYFVVIDRVFPFSLTQNHDNSGLLVGNFDDEVNGVLVALDITCKIVEEAVRIGANLIISHHPVIFDPIYTLGSNSVTYLLAKDGINAICCHSPMDIAGKGMNILIYNILKSPLNLTDSRILEPINDCGEGYGMICNLEDNMDAFKMAKILKEAFGCAVVRYADGGQKLGKIAFCSGAGGSMLKLAIEAGADGFITGDVKHSQMIEAQNARISMFDCGHFHTENIAMEKIVRILSQEIPNIKIQIAENNVDPCEYM